MKPEQVLSVYVKVEPRVMVIKGYSTFTKAAGQELYHQTQFSVISSIQAIVLFAKERFK